MSDFDVHTYLKEQKADTDARKNRKKGPSILKNDGDEHTFITKPFTVISGASHETTGIGNPDARLTAAKTKRPDSITLGNDDEGQ